MSKFKVLLFSLISTVTLSSWAETVKDNSFLMEEAYNQERGVVQFIQTYKYLEPSKEWAYSFTNELPITDETHQFAYIIPVMKLTPAGSSAESKVGDVALNYRHQMINTEALAVTPGISLVLPTGDFKKGFGTGATGIKFNQSVSVTINDLWTNHWNAGFTYTPGAKDTEGNTANLIGYNFGTSVIYNMSSKTNFLCEFVAENNETVSGPEQKSAESSYYLLPGFRTAIAYSEDTEIVPGVGALLGFGPSAIEHERGFFLYLSIESKLW